MDRKGAIKAIWAISGNLGVTKENVYTLLSRETGKERMTDCDDSELLKFLKALDSYKSGNKAREGRITDKQHSFIKSLENQIGWADDPKHLRNFIKKYTKVDFLDWLTQKQASAVIEALKNIKNRMDKKVNEVI